MYFTVFLHRVYGLHSSLKESLSAEFLNFVTSTGDPVASVALVVTDWGVSVGFCFVEANADFVSLP